MSDINKTSFIRTFLVNGLPGQITTRDSHLQIFDNYVEDTRLRIRRIRNPETNLWVRVLEQRLLVNLEKPSQRSIVQVYLDESEYEVLKKLHGSEIRKNRYLFKPDDKVFKIDVYLGKLRGLNIATAEFDAEKAMHTLEYPDFAIKEVSNDRFFLGENLIEKEFADVQNHLSREKN